MLGYLPFQCLSEKGLQDAMQLRVYQGRMNIIAGRELDHLAGTGYVAKLCGQIQQAQLLFDNILLKTTHGVTPSRLCALLDKDSPTLSNRV